MASKKHIAIDQGTDFSLDLNFAFEEPLVLTNGYTARGSMRRHYSSNTAYDFVCSIVDADTVNISMTNSTTSAIPAGRYVYDVELVSPANIVIRGVEGMVTVYPQTTK